MKILLPSHQLLKSIYFLTFCALLLGTTLAVLSQNMTSLTPEILDRSLVSLGDTAKLQHVFAKAQRGEKIVLAFIGGSITEGAAATAKEKRYVELVGNWWKTMFPQSQIEIINAGIGATASNFGALRLQQDVLSKHPDVLVVEFAVNDEPSEASTQSFEGLVRQSLQSPDPVALLLLFMMKQDGANAQEPFARVGAHYNLPMVSYRDAIWPEIQSGRMKWEDLSPDTIHPKDSGHAYAAAMINAVLNKVLSTLPKNEPLLRTDPIPAPLTSNLYDHTSLFTGAEMKPLQNHGWTFEATANPKSTGWKATEPGSVLEFEIPGSMVFLQYWKIHGAMGITRVSIDGVPVGDYDAWFDKTWGGYNQTLAIAHDLTSKMHRIRIELLPEKNPSSSGTEFRVTGIGSAGS
jgi:lysophospholipase L1-like esterase